jgi:hypothetical protein
VVSFSDFVINGSLNVGGAGDTTTLLNSNIGLGTTTRRQRRQLTARNPSVHGNRCSRPRRWLPPDTVALSKRAI